MTTYSDHCDPFIERLKALSANRCHTHLEIATVAGVTGERIRQIQEKALRKLRRRCKSFGLEDELRAYFER